MSKELLFSVVIPTCNRPSLLAQCLDKIKKEGTPDDYSSVISEINEFDYEIIVSDDSINADTAQLLRDSYPWVIYIKGNRKGPAANRNNGASIATGKWLVFTDDDCLPSTDWLFNIYQSIINYAKEDLVGIEGAIEALGSVEQDLVECPENSSGGVFWSANIAVEFDVFQMIGCFDENVPMAAFEDTDLYHRLRKQGVILFNKKVLVLHPVRSLRIIPYFCQLPKRIKSWAYYVEKYEEIDSRMLTQLKHSIHFNLRSMIRFLRKKQWGNFLMASVRLFVAPLLLSYFLITNKA